MVIIERFINKEEIISNMVEGIKCLKAELRYPGNTFYLKYIRAHVEDFAHQLKYSKEEIEKLRLSVDEACTNVIDYSYKNGINSDFPKRRKEDKIINPIDVLIEANQNECRISVTNRGVDFDPIAFKQKSDSLDEKITKKEVGGYGILFITTLMDKVEYIHEHKVGNVLSMVYYKKQE